MPCRWRSGSTAIGANPIPTTRRPSPSTTTGVKRMWPTTASSSATSDSESAQARRSLSTRSASTGWPKASSLTCRTRGASSGLSGRMVIASSRRLRPNGHHAKADVVVTPLRLEPQPKGRPAGPTVVAPAPAPAHPRRVASPVQLSRGTCVVQVGIDAAGQLRVGPVPAPLVGVAVHVVQPPGVGGVAADFGGPARRRPRLAPVVRLPLEVRLLVAELVAERGGRRRPAPAGVFPLRLGGQPELPLRGEVARLAAELGEFLAERFRLGKVDVAHG